LCARFQGQKKGKTGRVTVGKKKKKVKGTKNTFQKKNAPYVFGFSPSRKKTSGIRRKDGRGGREHKKKKKKRVGEHQREQRKFKKK